MSDIETEQDTPEANDQAGQGQAAAEASGEHTAQGEMPFAIVEGQPMTQLPLDLYIPPDALEVFLDAFEGPLDLLLYLIKRQNLDILDIKVAEITRQYMDYIDLMKNMQLELAAEYLVMAAVLAEIKSRMLLPRHEEDEDDEEDPRAELIRRLQEYERFKQAAMDIDEMPRRDRDYWVGAAEVPKIEKEKPLPDVQLQEMLIVLAKVLKRADTFTSHRIELEPLSTRERMSSILERVHAAGDQFIPFIALFDPEEGKAGVVVTFLAMMELIKESLLDIVQTEAFAPIHVKTRSVDDNATEPEQI
jgi:segregation and condensation protein A